MNDKRSHGRRDVTIRNVAAQAGVSIMTVSRAFNAPETVASETLRKIEAAAAAAGYVPHGLAGALRSGVSRLVAAIVPSLENNLFSEFLQGLADGLSEHGLLLTVGNGKPSDLSVDRLVLEYLALKPRALVLHERLVNPQMVARLRAMPIEVFEVGDMLADPIQHNISFSNEAAAMALTQHMLSRGRRRVALLMLPAAISARSRVRLEGYKAALAARHIPFDPELVIELSGGYDAAIEATNALLAAGKIDGIIGGGDVFAIGAHLACLRAKIRIPDDVAIASFDDHPICCSLVPALTALVIPRRQIGLTVAKIIAERGRDAREVEPIRKELEFSLVVRDST